MTNNVIFQLDAFDGRKLVRGRCLFVQRTVMAATTVAAAAATVALDPFAQEFDEKVKAALIYHRLVRSLELTEVR